MRNVLLLLLSAALLVGAWWALGRSPERGPADADAAGRTTSLVAGWDELSGTREAARTSTSGRAATGTLDASSAQSTALRPGSNARAMDAGITEASAASSAPRESVFVAGREPMLFEGRVLPDGSREPVAGALVTLRAGEDKSEAETDEQGHFALKWLRGLPGDLAIEHDEFVDLRMAALEPEGLGKDPEFTLTPSGALVGTVMAPAGFALEGTHVDVWRTVSKGERDWLPFEAEVDADGGFHLGDLEPGNYALCPEVEGLSGRFVAGVAVPIGREVFVELECTVGGELIGQLVGPPGFTMPDLEGATVELLPRDVGLPKTLARDRKLEVEADASGAFSLVGIPPGAHRLRIEPPWGGIRSFNVDLDGSGERIEREFELSPPARVEGVVLGADGKAQGGASVFVGHRKDKSAVANALTSPSADELLVADHDGRFLVDPVAAGEQLVLIARGGSEPPAWMVLEALAPGESRTGVVLQLPARLEVRGRARALSQTGAVGEHLAGAHVVARYQTDGREFTFASAETDADGQFVLPALIPGHVRLEARAEGYLEDSIKLELVEGVEPVDVDLALARALELRGRVVDEDGAGIGALRVRATAIDPDLSKDSRAALKGTVPPDRMARSDIYGRFVFSALAEADWFLTPLGGDFELVESHPRYCDGAFSAGGGEAEVVVRRLPKSERAGLDFTVVRSDSGLAPEGLDVHGAGAGAVTIDGGEVVISALAPKPVRLTLTADGCASQYVDVILSPGRIEHLGLVQLDPGARVTIDVKNKGGAAMKSAKVRLMPRDEADGGPRFGTPVLKLKHTGGGRYRTEGVPLGMWDLKVTLKGASTYRAALEVKGTKAHRTVKMEEKKARPGR